MKTVDFSTTIAASDLTVGRCRQLIEFMMVSIEGQGHLFTIYFPGFVCFVISGERLQDHWSSGLMILIAARSVLGFRTSTDTNRPVPFVIFSIFFYARLHFWTDQL